MKVPPRYDWHMRLVQIDLGPEFGAVYVVADEPRYKPWWIII